MKNKIIKAIKKNYVGIRVPVRENGNVGIYVEDMLEAAGITVNRGKGADLPGADIKTRQIGSTSAHTIGAMSRDAIINTAWEDSNIFEKAQQQYRVEYDGEINTIISSKIVDFRDPYIQDRFKSAYDAGKALLANSTIASKDLRYVRGTKANTFYEKNLKEIGYFEWKASNQYQFRIPEGNMKKLLTTANNTFNLFFE